MSTLPLKRRPDLVSKEMDGELVVYNPHDNQCHVLNPAAAIAWEQAGSDPTIESLADSIAAGTDLPNDPEVAYLALEELNDAGLLESAPVAVQSPQRMDRRQMLLRKGVLVAAALPAVASLLSPTKAMAGSPDLPEEPT